MKKTLLLIALVFSFITYLAGQTKITTAAVGNVGYNGTNYIGGNTTITFVVQNNSSNDIVLTDVEDFKATNGPGFPLNTGSFNLWYSATSLSGDPGLISTANWTKINGETPVAVALVPGYNTIFSNLSFIIPANTTYRFALESFTGLAYSGGLTPGLCSPSTLTKDSVSLILGDAAIAGQSVGYAGAYPNSSYTNSWFTGSITFHTAQPCIAPPNAGNTVSVTSDTCAGFPFKLDLSGQSAGVGQTYQWQSSINNTSYSNITGATESSLKTSQLISTYYRCAVTCSGLTSYSTPLQITTPISVSGTYTINSGSGTGGSNFATFTEAIDFIKCGINGPVVFNVVSGSGPYNEQIKLPYIGGASSINTVTFNGNGEKLTYNASTATNKAIVTFDNASHIVMDSLTIDGLIGAYNWNILFTNKSDSNIIRKCNITNNNTSTSLVNNICIMFNGSSQFLATSANNANYNVIEKNTINGGAYGIYMYGSGVNTENVGNIIQSNTVQDFYNSGIYVANGLTDLVISKNDIYRPSRSNTATSIYGINTTNTCLNMLIEKNKIHNLFDAISSNTATCYAFNIGANGAIAKETKLNNNIVYNMNGYGAIYGINNSANYLQAFHNTIVLDEFSSFNGTAFGFVQANAASNVDFSNNIISITRNSTGKHRCLNVSNTSNIISNHNVLYLNCPASVDTAIGQWGTVLGNTLNAWRLLNGSVFDQQSVSINPMFVNAGINDFTPTAVNVNDIGKNVNISTDVLGNTRNINNPDPGAYEFSISACTNPPTAGVAVSTINATCPANLFGLELSGNSFGTGQTYQWQSSSNNSTFTNVGSASANIFYSTNQPSSNYYRCAVQCNGGAVVYSTSILITTPSYLSGTFTIDNALPTGGSNFTSFGDAINAIKCGINGPVVFNVVPHATPYQESFTIPDINGTSAINTLTIKGNGATLVYTTSDANNRVAVMLNGADHIIIDSLNIDVSGGTQGWAILLTNSADSNVISNCNITASVTSTNVGSAGIVYNGSSISGSTSGNNANNNIIKNNTITGGYHGIWLYGNNSSTTQNINNRIIGNTILDMYGYGVYAVHQPSGLLVSKNNISRPSRTNSTSAGGVYISSGCADVLVEKNKIHNLFDAMLTNTSANAGVFLGATPTAGYDNNVVNNLIYNMNGNGAIHGITCTFGGNAKMYHNTIVLDDQSATTGLTYGIYQPVQATGIDFRNNIVYVTRSGSGAKSCLWYGTSLSTINSNNNVLFTTTGKIATLQSTTYTTLANWQAAGGNIYDQQSVSVDPVFTSITNYKPTASAIDNIGASIGITTDMNDTTRSNNPDPGCYEFASSLPITLLDFKGVQKDGITTLIWTTASEMNNNGFEIQKSYTNTDFVKIGFVNSKAANGNSNTILEYSFKDIETKGKNAYYKLKQIDKDGKYSFSKTILIKASLPTSLQITTLYPNPVVDQMHLAIASPIQTKATIIIYDIFGKVVKQQNIDLLIGENMINVNVSQLAGGNYVLKLVSINSPENAINKFTKK